MANPKKVLFPFTAPLFFCVILLLVATFLRLWQLESLPGELHRDEASIGYNAYSILLTGHDEYGVSWPFNFRAFGEYKLPGLIYATVPFIQWFGLNEWAIRLPTALAGILTLPVLFWCIRELGYTKRVATIGVILLSLSFWHITQSRNVYEPLVGLLWSTLALTTWLRAQRQPLWAVASIGFYLLSAIFYNVPWLLMPLLYIVISLQVHSTEIVKKKVVLSALVIIILCGVGIGIALQGVNTSRSSVTVFNNPELTKTSEDFLYASLVAQVPSRIARVIELPITLQLQTLFASYLSSFNPAYLFSLGDVNPWHNLRNIHLGNFNPVLIVPMLAGLLVLIKQWNSQSSRILTTLLVLTPLISGLTIEAPITNRLLDFHLALTILAAVGVDYLWSVSNTTLQKSFFVGLMIAYFAFFGIFFFRYFYTFNFTLDYRWNQGIKSMIQTIQPLEGEYSSIFIHGWDLSYIFVAFYHPFPPTEFSKDAQRYISGFDHVGQFQKYHFATPPTLHTIDSDFLYKHLSSNQGVLIALRNKATPPPGRTIAQQTKHTGEVLWTLYEITREDLLRHYKKQTASPEIVARVQYLTSCETSCDKTILEPFLTTTP